MSGALLVNQALNGLQLGVLLFLLAAGLTLIFGIMNFVNLAHGSLYMLGAYVAALAFNATGSFLMAFLAMVPACLVLGWALDRLVGRFLYRRDHLYQVLATFGLILVANEAVRRIFGPSPYYMSLPDALTGTIDLMGIQYPAYRFSIILVGLAVALGCYLLINRTRFGMLIRAGASDAMMVGALGVDIARMNALLFGLGAVLAGLAGLMAGPILSLQPGMGEPILILAMVVIVIGGVGSIRGAFIAALIVGVVDTMGRALLPQLLRQLFDRATAQAAGPALASMLIYCLMAAVLALRPAGLFPVRTG